MNIEKLNEFKDEKGRLVPIEFRELPFSPKRIFIVSDVLKNEIRGNHAHLKTKQLLICLNGEIEVVLHNGKMESRFIIKKYEKTLVPELIWDYQKFLTDDSVLLVICSTEYDQNDYIFDFEDFLRAK